MTNVSLLGQEISIFEASQAALKTIDRTRQEYIRTNGKFDMASQAYTVRIEAARSARLLADDYRKEAEETESEARRVRCLEQAQEAQERAQWYEFHASLMQRDEEEDVE